MPTLFITVGISASGKSTFAQNLKAQYEATDRNIVEINRDIIRFTNVMYGADWSTYKFTHENENKVTEIANSMFSSAVENKTDIIISDTNLNKKFRDALVEKGRLSGYDVKLVDFPISLEEAWRRDAARHNGVGHQVIARQYKSWLAYTGESTVYDKVRDESIEPQILVNVSRPLLNSVYRSNVLKYLINAKHESMIFISFDMDYETVSDKLYEFFGLEHQLIVATGTLSFDTFIEMSRNGSTNVCSVIEHDPIKCHYWSGIGFNEVINLSEQ